jgi:hypothetical protein
MTVRIGNASGFYGDRLSAMREMLTGGPLDYLTGDYLAELTMLILGRDRMKDASRGYARTFLRQLEDTLDLALENNVKIVTNAGGLNPAGLAAAIRELNPDVKVAHVEGDDLLQQGFDGALTANAYLGCWGIVECLNAGADVVVTGRVTDASLVVGPAAAHFGWDQRDLDALAGATVAGHVIECGTQATGGNFAFFTEIPDLSHPGFPIAEIDEHGNSVITKHDGTGGVVTVDTVKAQLLYEIAAPAYLGPDVTARFDTITVTQQGDDRVAITGVKGDAPPDTLKVCVNTLDGFRNGMTFVLCGLDIDHKAALARQQLENAVGSEGLEWTLARTDHPDADTEEAASALLHATIHTPDSQRAKAFSRAAVELALASYPGFTLTSPPGDGTPVGVYHAKYVPQEAIHHEAVLPDGTRRTITPPDLSTVSREPAESVPTWSGGPTTRAPLGVIAGARSGDKGGDANLGVWVRDPAAYPWLAGELTVDRIRELLPEAKDLDIDRHLLPNLSAINFVLHGLLGKGVAASTRFDPQAKSLGEWLRSRVVDIPASLL